MVAVFSLQACQPGGDSDPSERSRISIDLFATVNDRALNEISGLEVTPGPHFIVHNDDGGPDLWLLDARGETLKKFNIKGAKNRDWEDLTQVESDGTSLLAASDTGDNLGRHSSVQVYFVETPDMNSKKKLRLVHALDLTYPDGPRDCEAMAFDAASDSLLFMTKRDRPPRLYRVDIDEALSESSLELEFLGTVPTFRPPGPEDVKSYGMFSQWVSQPTGMDINSEGNLAAIITYRSLYLFARQPHETWLEAFQNPPREFLGPASNAEEAIAFGPDMKHVFISSEGHPAPIYRAELPKPKAKGE